VVAGPLLVASLDGCRISLHSSDQINCFFNELVDGTILA
jgi:hypothetical protein